MIGNVLGNRYRILREIGSGGMAKVYLAEDVRGNELVAVKVLYPQFSEDLSFIQRFNREAKLASTLTDPHIVRVLDYGADRDLNFLVMEYVEGQDLHETLQEKGSFEWKFALEIIDQLATALEQAHAHGVVHRDLKPQNMMLNDSGLLKVLDFGIARVPTLPSLTQSGFIGSPYYASPEQAMGEEVDVRSDIYSAGIVLYELLSGDIPFDAKSPWSIISQHITSEPPPIEAPHGEIPKSVQNLLNGMLAKRPEERFQTPTALRRAVAEVLAGRSIPEDTRATQPLEHADKVTLIDSLYERATEAVEAQEWARAVDLLSQAAKLDPSNMMVAEKLVTVEREARLISLYKAGRRAMENGLWEEALNHFNVIVELEPGYKNTEALLSEAHQALKEEDAQQFVATRYREGVAHFEAERWKNAVQAFEEVQQFAPDFEQVEQLLAEARQYSNPGLLQKLAGNLGKNTPQNLWRWGLVVAGVIAIVFLSFLAFGNNNQAAGDDDVKQHLKLLYEEAQLAIENGNTEEAVAKLEQILSEDPDYADVAELKRELIATPTPLPTSIPTPMPTPTIVVVISTPEEDPLADFLDEAQTAVDVAQWSEAIDALNQVRTVDAEYQKARVASLFCDAYVGRGLEMLVNIGPQEQEAEIIRQALTDFEAGVVECPRRTDLKEQAERAAAYLETLNTPNDDYETLIPILVPIVAADPDYASRHAKKLLYSTYLDRARAREQAPETLAAALGDYEAALALNVDDPSEAHLRRAELLLLFSQGPVQPTPQPVETPTRSPEEVSTPVVGVTPSVVPTPTPEPVRIIYKKPKLIAPEDDAHFAGQFSEVILEWEPVGELAAGEYYDLTIMHLFADEPQYAGSTRTRETRMQINPDIGVGEAGGDRFYWWVTVRKDNTAPLPDGLDLPLSLRSDAGTFVWTP